MAIETPPTVPPPSGSLEASPIENELAAYRAIAPNSVVSLIFGVLSGLAFADPRFLIASGLAILCGALALRAIHRQSDILTGGGLARVGIALGLAFALSSVTIRYVRETLVAREAEQFVVQDIVPLINDRDLDGTLWFKMPPESRRGMTPEQARTQIRGSSDSDPMFFERAAGDIYRLIETVLKRNPNGLAHFDRIESSGYDGVTPIAIALIRIEGVDIPLPTSPATAPGRDEGPTYLGVIVKREGSGANQAWWVSEFRYPYQPQSLIATTTPKPPDDGHGHAH